MAGKLKSPHKNLVSTISVRVQHDVFAAFEAQRTAANLSKSEFFRDYIAMNKIYVNARPAPSRETRRAMLLLQKISNHIGLLAYRASKDNLAGVLADEYYKEFINQLTHLNELLLSQSIEVKHDS